MFDPMRINGWSDWVKDALEVIEVPGMHGIFHNEPYVRVLAEKMNACLEQADRDDEKVPSNLLTIKEQLVQIWQRVLGISSISVNDNFFKLGGDSLKAAIFVAEVEKLLGWEIPLASLAEAPTIEQLAKFNLKRFYERIASRPLVPIKPHGNKRPVFCVHGIGGQVVGPSLTHYLHSERPFYGLQAVGLDGEKEPYTRIEDMVAHYIQEVQSIQAEGPYLLAGSCIGGNIAFEMAQQLEKQGQQVSLVAMIDSLNPLITQKQKDQTWNYWIVSGKPNRREELINTGLGINLIENILKVWEANWQLIINHVPQVYSGQVAYLSAVDNRMQSFGYQFDPMQPNGWNSFVSNGIKIIEVPGSHLTLYHADHLQILSEKLDSCLEQSDQKPVI